MQWYFQHTPNDNRDYDSSGSQIIIDGKVNGEDRKLLAHANRNGFHYALDRLNGQFLKAVQYSAKVTWTKGIDPKTGKPVDYDPGKDVQNFALPWKGGADVLKGACPDVHGGTNFWPPAYSQKTKLLYIAGNEGCANITPDPTAHVKGKFGGGNYVNEERITSSLAVVDPATGELKTRKELPYANHSRRAGDGGRRRGHGAARRHRSSRSTTRRSKSCGRSMSARLRRAADDLFGQRQAIHRDRVRHRRGRHAPSSRARPRCARCRTRRCCSCSGCDRHHASSEECGEAASKEAAIRACHASAACGRLPA